jgi:hypothetical protein
MTKLRTIRADPQGYRALVRYRDRQAASWRPCPVFGALAEAAECDVRESRRAIEEGHRVAREEARRFWQSVSDQEDC